MKKFAVVLTLFLWSVFTVMSQTDSVKVAQEARDNQFPWGRTLFVAVGAGIPEGLRAELGFTFARYFSMGLTVGYTNMWYRESYAGTVGIFARGSIPIEGSPVSPYLLVGIGSHGIFKADGFVRLTVGVLYSIKPWLQLRPELGLLYTDKHISGGGIFGGTPVVYQSRITPCAAVVLELDLRPLFNLE